MDSSALRTLSRARSGQRWCLFLDRDGVINRRILDGYVRDWDEFEFEPGALEALATLSAWAPRIVVVTNQQGVGKGLMSEEALTRIHRRMRSAVTAAGGRINEVVRCPHLASDGCDCRKPQPGLALRYLDEHAELDPAASVMVGDADSDIEMARRLFAETGGGTAVRIAPGADPVADLTYPSLAAFAAAVAEAQTYSAE